MSGKITYKAFNDQMKEHQRSFAAGGKRIPRPRLADVDLSSVPAEKRGLVKELLERERR